MRDRLVRGVFTNNMAAAALDAQVLVDNRLFDVVEVQVLPVGHARHGPAHQFRHRPHALVVEKSAEAVRQVINDLEAVDHCRRADLDVVGAEREEINRVTPIGDATDAGYRNVCGVGIARNFGDHVEGYRFHGFAAVAAVRAHAVRGRVHCQRVVIDAHDRIDRIDQRDCIGPAVHRGLRRRHDMCHVRSQFDDNGNSGNLLAPLGRHLNIFGDLAYGCPHAAFGHAVRAAEVKLEGVGAGIFDHGHVFRPRLLVHR